MHVNVNGANGAMINRLEQIPKVPKMLEPLKFVCNLDMVVVEGSGYNNSESENGWH